MYEFIEIKGANEHNLKNVSVKIPKNKIVAITGPSGSGKSTFAFDILQRECQRQYMESMGMVTDGMNKAKVDSIVGLSPSISISQGINNRNPRSTIGTSTEILTYLRLLYAKCGVRECPQCHQLCEPSFITEDTGDIPREKKMILCPHCESRIPILTMAHFSFNKSEGFCEGCSGIGEVNEIDPNGILDMNLSVGEGAVQMWQGVMSKHYEHVLNELGKHYKLNFNTNKKIKEYNDLEKLIFFEGVNSTKFKELYPNVKPPKKVSDGYFEGVLTFLKKKSAENIRKGSSNKNIEKCFKRSVCPKCHGTRLNKQARSVYVDEKTIVEVSSYTIDDLKNWVSSLSSRLSNPNYEVLDSIVTDILRRVESILQIGLGYLTIDRTIRSLSGGEAQRLRMASLMDSGLTGVLYILDEPTTGLHPKDTLKILRALKKLVTIGNTVLVIEHDMDFVNQCDYVIDFGPSSGNKGGRIIAQGVPKEIPSYELSLTGKYLNKHYEINSVPKSNTLEEIRIVNAHEHNLNNVNISIPLKKIVTFTGVSGSGKSTLVFDVLAATAKGKRKKVDSIEGLHQIHDVIQVKQQRIGKSSRSTVATYTDIFKSIRNILSAQDSAKKQNLKSSHFSFNVKGGRCEKCQGLGTIPLDMHFLDDIEVQCPVCHGKRFNNRVLDVKYKNYNVSEILDMTVKQNMEIFKEYREVFNRLSVLNEVGLGYLALGQSISTLSGGECQRIKLSKELGRSGHGHTLYLLDEPTTGLHPSDIEKLIILLKKLVSRGNSVVIIEHSLEVISQSDWIIDLGPDGGSKGGMIVAEGTPANIGATPQSYTGEFLQI